MIQIHAGLKPGEYKLSLKVTNGIQQTVYALKIIVVDSILSQNDNNYEPCYKNTKVDRITNSGFVVISQVCYANSIKFLIDDSLVDSTLVYYESDLAVFELETEKPGNILTFIYSTLERDEAIQ